MNDIRANERALRLFEDESIVAAGNSISAIINLDAYKPNGYMTLQLKTTGATSTVKVEMFCGINGVSGDMVVPNGASDIITAHAAGTGLYNIEPEMAVKYIKFKFTGAVATAVVNAWLLIQ